MSPLKHDPIEDTPEFKAVIKKVEKELDELLKDVPKSMGFCHMYWYEKRRILKEKYGIDWKSPALMNPRVRFD